MLHEVDVRVGKRVRQRRWQMGMTQHDLGEKTGVKFQQIQKYETGANRVSASRLWDIASALDVQITYFFEGMDGKAANQNGEPCLPDFLEDKEAIELVRAYYSIPEPSRRKLYDLAKVLGA
ncbi:Transcriptional regulator, contains XRE-family HTH domain [Aliiroseovarius crassostreae]|uniref:Cro/Cl family transcriptional regulator n=1 Tax=Aliiroseovarius crassostreae TaxID=154981 RepID=A0A0P7JP10_9RHOB|nr:helix-turn-helix transcriptional regulator [Aliiroseovarius crassostreae]KPN62962.1 Cro/Cl family transcriptional regulator [Aliiroseovarius crassostreae]SFU89416.1 Transcriptional regulator, contains XRE-family HTH domain [Aliiroseovarius crassostreae]